jgi:serine/threonine protein phosphatase 1
MALSLRREIFALPRAPADGVEILAIGDIHGRADLFEALLEAGGREPKRAARRVLVLTGDLVDRGPENLATLDLAREAGGRVGADEFAALMGNHEAMMRLSLDADVDFATGLDAFGPWLRNGGSEVVREFASTTSDAPLSPDQWLERARAALPGDIANWLRSLAPSWRSGGLLFVHAGVNPNLELEAFLAQPWNIPLRSLDQDRHWSWVREPFLRHKPGRDGFSSYFVVHGHTPRDAGIAPRHADQIARYRLNIDGGSGFTGEVKMALFVGASAQVITVSGPTNAELGS